MSTMMLDRAMLTGAMGMGGSMPMGQMGAMAGMMPAMGACMIPRCTLKMEKCEGGMKIHCVCDDEMSAAMLQKHVQDDGRQHDEPVLDDERHAHLPVQHGDVQVRLQDDQGRRVHYLHLWRQGLLRDDPGVLRLHVRLYEGRMHVLCVLQQHARLLWRLLLSAPAGRRTVERKSAVEAPLRRACRSGAITGQGPLHLHTASPQMSPDSLLCL